MVFLFQNISLSVSLFHLKVIHFISRLLSEIELDMQGIRDLVNTNARRHHNEVDHSTL
jgi:hypothetical protein